MGIKKEDIWAVDRGVDEMARLPIEKFCPFAIEKATGLSLKTVFKRLHYLEKDNKIRLTYEIRCPKCDGPRVIKYIDTITLGDKLQFCNVHGEFEIAFDFIFLLFRFEEDYKASLKT